MEYLRVKGWANFQHYKDRSPPWIKLHRELLRDYDFSCLQDASKLHLMLIWLLASQLDNKIPNDPAWIQRQIGTENSPNLKLLISSGFIVLEQDDSEVIAPCKQSALVETEAETEAETEKTSDSRKRSSSSAKRAFMDFCEANGCAEEAADWETVLKKKKAAFTERAWKMRLNKATAFVGDGYPLKKIIATSADSGWSDLYPPKTGGKAVTGTQSSDAFWQSYEASEEVTG